MLSTPCTTPFGMLACKTEMQSVVRDLQLALQVLGWDLPLEGLPYWVRGLEWPGAATAHETFDEQGRPKQLSQAGWHISYLDWAPAGVAGLPSKLDLRGERLRMRLLIEKWSVKGG